ncbi:MAG: hypothetical protein ACP5I7_05000 [Sulfolobales archaeon]|jgi:hypothetical protein
MKPYSDLVIGSLELTGLILIVLGVIILLIGLFIAYLPEIRRIYNEIPSELKPLILVSVKIGSLEIMISPILIIVLSILYLIFLYKT